MCKFSTLYFKVQLYLDTWVHFLLLLQAGVLVDSYHVLVDERRRLVKPFGALKRREIKTRA